MIEPLIEPLIEGPFFSLSEKKDLGLEKTKFFLAQPLIEESPPPDPEFAEKSMDEIIRLECEWINSALPNLSTKCEKTSFFLVQQLKQLELIKRSTTLKKIDKHYLYEKQLQLITEIDDIDDINPSSLYFKCENNLFTNILDIVMNDLIAFFA